MRMNGRVTYADVYPSNNYSADTAIFVRFADKRVVTCADVYSYNNLGQILGLAVISADVCSCNNSGQICSPLLHTQTSVHITKGSRIPWRMQEPYSTDTAEIPSLHLVCVGIEKDGRTARKARRTNRAKPLALFGYGVATPP